MKLKNSNYDETKKIKLWWNSKTQIVIKLKTPIVLKLKNSNCDEIQKLKLWWNLKTKMVTAQCWKDKMKQSKVNLKELLTPEKRSWHIIDQNIACKKGDIHLSLITLNQKSMPNLPQLWVLPTHRPATSTSTSHSSLPTSSILAGKQLGRTHS